MLAAFDLDGTVDSDPAVFGALMQALRAAGSRVVVLTGASGKHVPKQELAAKADYLSSLGLGHAYDKLVVVGSPPHKAKATWCEKHHADLLVDNATDTAVLAAKFCTVLVPWASATKTLDAPPAVACAVVKASEERRYTLGLAYPANRPDRGVAADGHRDFVSARVLEDAAWSYLRKGAAVGLDHSTDPSVEGRGTVVESYIWPGDDWKTGNTVIKKGDWLLGVVWQPDTWPLVKAGRLNGFSPQGRARRGTPTPETIEKLRRD